MNLTLNSNDWDGYAAPYTYEINNSHIKKNSVCDLLFNPNYSGLVEAISKYKIIGYDQYDGRILIYAWGEKPSMNLDATLIVRGGY